MRKITNVFLLSLLSFFLIGFLQSCQSGMNAGDGGDGMSWKNKLKIADKFYEQGFYYDAVNYYEEVLETHPEDVDVIYKLAESYFNARDYKNARDNYKLVAEKDDHVYAHSHYKYALCLKMIGDFRTAKTEFSTFIKSYRAYDTPVYKKKVKNEIEGCDMALKAIENPLNVVIVHMGSVINAGYTEASPLPFEDDKLLFSALKSDTLIVTEDIKEKAGRFQLYQSSISRMPGRTTMDIGSEGQMRWSTPELLPKEINAPGKDVANGSFSPDGKNFYYTQCEQDKTGKMICDLYVSEYKNESWSKGHKLPETINVPGFTKTHPTVGNYKKGSQLLYFVSDMPGSVGGLDIWYVEITKGGQYKDPKNLGKKVNTVSDELTPFYNNNSKILYFSSNGHPGFGGYDVFMTVGQQRKWTKPENVGFPLNSSVDDMYFVADSDEEGGYLVSNRPGTIALKSETCCDDIFRYNWDRDYIPKFAVRGISYDEADASKTVFKQYDIKLYQLDRDSTEVLINESTILDGTEFLFGLKQNKKYKLVASKEGYFPNDVEFNTVGLRRSDTLYKEIPLKKLELNMSIVLKDVYYDFDKSSLRPESDKTLTNLVEILNTNPGIVVELSSHTDSKGDDAYNKKLSQRRAESVVRFLRKAGIDKSRLVPKGYGETIPIADNENPDGTDNPEGRQLNRRTEIKVIGKTDVEIKKKTRSLDDAMIDSDGK